jgi:N-sulfoglucosamine sulfohydrolase
MIKTSKLWVIGLISANLPFISCSTENRKDSDKSRPNIILITGDDLGLQLGSYGDKYARTPALDSLANEGVIFSTTWVTQSSSSPSRSSIFTGLYPHQNGQIGLAHLGFESTETPVLPNLLKAAGYRTGLLGKFHVAPGSAYKFDMIDQGNWSLDIRRVLNEAKQFIESDSVKPFFLKIGYYDTHEPFVDQVKGYPVNIYKEGEVKVMDWARGNRDSLSNVASHLYNALTREDNGVSMLVDYLKKAELLDNTMIIFLGDNGPDFAGGKVTCYDAGLRVPLIIYWKGGKIKTGQVRNELISTIDILPTILDACGVAIPDSLDGRSLLPLLHGETSVEWRSYLFGEMNFHQPANYKPMRTVRDNNFHLIHNLIRNPEWEFFDLKNDPNEFINLAGDTSYSKLLDEYKKELYKWRVDTHDPLLNAETAQKWLEFSKKYTGNQPAVPPVVMVK